MKYLIPFLLIIIVACSNAEQKTSQKDSGVIEPYKPKDTADFSHSVHAKNNIDCKYCHNERTKTDKHELTVNICANCHLSVTGTDADTVK